MTSVNWQLKKTMEAVQLNWMLPENINAVSSIKMWAWIRNHWDLKTMIWINLDQSLINSHKQKVASWDWILTRPEIQHSKDLFKTKIILIFPDDKLLQFTQWFTHLDNQTLVHHTLYYLFTTLKPYPQLNIIKFNRHFHCSVGLNQNLSTHPL